MKPHSFRCSLPLLAVLALILSGFGACGEAPWLSGKILVEREGKEQPIGGARVYLYPLAPLGKGKPAPENAKNLSSAAVTRDGGNFEFSELSSNVSYESFELLQNWRYRLRIEDTAYYIKDFEFDFEDGNNYLVVRLKEKKSDVEAGDGEGIGEDTHVGGSGSVKRN